MTSSPVSSSSLASSPNSTPARTRDRRPVGDILAELSDSDGNEGPLIQIPSRNTRIETPNNQVNEGDSSEEDLPLGGGRLANRLAGKQTNKETASSEQETTSNSTTHIHQERLDAIAGRVVETAEITTPQPRKRLLLKRKRISDDEQSPNSLSRSRLDESIHKSPTPTRSANLTSRDASPQASSTHEEASITDTGKAKFLLLVEKARKQREAREAAEEAKKAANAAQRTLTSPQKTRPRGSSPADNSEEDSDQSHNGAAQKLSKAAPPTRKASKKAVQDIKRETQRLTRNMQLAPEARTKKKFTKESFFASFNGGMSTVDKSNESQEKQETLQDSSSSSESEVDRLHSTPPTSPLRSPALNKTIQPTVCHDAAATHVAVAGDAEEAESFEDMFASRRAENHESRKPVKIGISSPIQQSKQIKIPATVYSARSMAVKADPDSDSDIEVVYNKGDRRKFELFENIPKKKAKEMPSHIALRSLAHIRPHKDQKSIMSQGDMGPSLLRAARKQASEERQEKIAKLKAAGVTIQTAEEKEQDEEALEDLVERARQEDEVIRKREKELAKKDGTYVKDVLEDDDSDDVDDDFQDDPDTALSSDSGEEDGEAEDENKDEDRQQLGSNGFVDEAAETGSEESVFGDEEDETSAAEGVSEILNTPMKAPHRAVRNTRVILDDDEAEENLQQPTRSPILPMVSKTPQSILRSNRKIIPGLQHSDDLPIGLTQAFAATMADSQTQDAEQTQEQDSMDILRDLPSPHISMLPRLNRLESIDFIDESVPATQTQPLQLDLSLSQSQRIPESPTTAQQLATFQDPFELTQDAGYSFSPFSGNRFAEIPRREIQSTEDTVVLPTGIDSPILQRKGRLQRGRQASIEVEDGNDVVRPTSAFQVMSKAAQRKKLAEFNKKKSEARRAVDEAAEESDDEYAGLGGVSDEDSNDEENEDDKKMIDEDTQVGQGDESKLAKLHADREREADAAAVSKMMKDIATGALRHKRRAGDDLDLSDEEDANTRRREAKRREFAKMRRELLKDEAVGKIAEDKKKQAFLKSIEDRDEEEEEIELDRESTPTASDSQEQSQVQIPAAESDTLTQSSKPLMQAAESRLNQTRPNVRRTKLEASRRPGTLAEIRESVSFLIEEPDSQAGLLDLGLSDSEDEPEAYVDLDRHFQQAEADEDAMNDENADLGDFVIDDGDDTPEDDNDHTFKKPELPNRGSERAPFSERRTKPVEVIDRLELLRQASSSSASGSNASSKMAFLSSRQESGSLTKVPHLLRRATTNASVGSMSGRETISATGVVTSKTERGSAANEKDFVRKGASTNRNAVNYQGRQNLKEEKMSARAGVMKKQQKRKTGKFLTGLFRGDSWS